MAENDLKNGKPKGVYFTAFLIILSDMIVFWNVACGYFDQARCLTMSVWSSRLIHSLAAVPLILRSRFFPQKLPFFYDILLVIISFGCALGLLRFKNLARIFLIVFCWVNIAYIASVFLPSIILLIEKGGLSLEFFYASVRDCFLPFMPAFIYSVYLTYPKVRWRFR